MCAAYKLFRGFKVPAGYFPTTRLVWEPQHVLFVCQDETGGGVKTSLFLFLERLLRSIILRA